MWPPPPGEQAPRRPRVTLTDRGRGMLAAGLTLAASGVVLGFVDLTRVGLLTAMVPVLGRLVAGRAMPRLVVSRRVEPATVTVGALAQVLVTVTNHGSRRCRSLLAEETVGAGLGEPVRFTIGPLAAGQSATVEYTVRPRRRGRHRTGGLLCHWRDPFGTTAVAMPDPAALEIIALPAIHQLGGLPATPGIGSEGAVPTMSVAHGEDDTSIRGYREGDDLRRIHWPVTAHRGELMVRHEGRPTLRRAVLVLDPGSTPPAPPTALPETAHPEPTALDWAADALVSVAAHLAAHGYTLHLVTPRTVAADQASAPMAVAGVARELALTEPLRPGGRDHPTGPPLLSQAHDLAARGGLVVAAVVGGARADSIGALLGIRPPAGRGLLFVIDDPAGTGSSGVSELAALATAHGWSAVPVPAATAVVQAWQRLLQSDAPVGVR